MKLRAYAKINLTLDITGRREDGYHCIDSIMQSVSVADEIELDLTDGQGIEISTNLSYLPVNEKNTAFKAAKRYLEAIAFPHGASEATHGVKISIRKNIPSRAGMGGGSSDAAAVLLGLNALHDNRLSEEEMLALAAKIGADVPFCLLGGTKRCGGIGDVMKPAAPMPDCHLVICKPEYGMSTPRAYQIIDKYPLAESPQTPAMMKALEAGNIKEVAAGISNRFDEVLRMRVVQEAKRVMKGLGALNALMTGSGSAVFGIFTDEKAARACRMALEKRETGIVFAARPARRGVEIIGGA